MPEPRQRRSPARPSKMWSGRLDSGTAASVERYTRSVDEDQRLAAVDVEVSLAHALMLRQAGLLDSAEHDRVAAGLRSIALEIAAGDFGLLDSDEDVHSAVERRLHELIGAAAGRLHTGRSRNDQVATDLRLYTLRAGAELGLAVADLIETLLDRASEHVDTVMPGYTHLQRAQPVSLAHHLLAYVAMLQRDLQRLAQARDRCDVLPLGSGALAGSTLPLRRDVVAAELGFSRLSENSLDAVADRDFAVEMAFVCALLLTHLSRLAEETVLWCAAEFGYAELPDTHATGSSLMPQKKNPDVAELARARSGRVLGDLVTLLSLLRGLPLAYNRDLQEDKRALFDALDTTRASVEVLRELVAVLRFDVERLRQAAADPMLRATDVAEHLVLQGVAFREAHRAVGQMVQRVLRQGRSLRDVSLQEWRDLEPRAGEEITSLFDLSTALSRRDAVQGGPGPRSVAAQIERARAEVAAWRSTSGA